MRFYGFLALFAVACGSGSISGNPPAGAAGGPLPAGGSGGSGPSGTGGDTVGGGGSGQGGSGSGQAGSGQGGPKACSEAQKPYTLAAVKLDASLVPSLDTGGFGGGRAQLPVTVDPMTGRLYVGFTRKAPTTSANFIAEDGAAASVVTVPDAIDGGIAVTSNGVAILLFDPAPKEDDRRWASVARFGTDGKAIFTTDLFRSANLTDDGTKGAPSTSRLAYIGATDQILAYFGHTQMYVMMTSMVRHQGGYLAVVDAAGKQTVLDGWFGSHNLDQRVIVDGGKAAVLGLGDAYPKGIIYSAASTTAKPRANAIYPLAANGVGATNGQLGGIQDGGDAYVIPFVTNQSLPQNFDAGVWPNIDDAKSKQIGDTAKNGTDLGLLRMSKTMAAPIAGLTANWLDAQRGKELGEATSISMLKSARYGTGYYLLAWKETSTVAGSKKSGFFTMVIDGQGGVCQPKTALAPEYQFTTGDDFVTRPDGRISWANANGNVINIVTLTP
jgi:hypothetical protein